MEVRVLPEYPLKWSSSSSRQPLPYLLNITRKSANGAIAVSKTAFTEFGIKWRLAANVTPKYGTLARWRFWATGTWKGNPGRGCLWTSLSAKDSSSRRNSIVLSSSPGISSTREDWHLSREETRSRHYTLMSFVTNYRIFHLVFLGPFIFPKNNLFSPKSPISPPFLFPIRMGCKPEF